MEFFPDKKITPDFRRENSTTKHTNVTRNWENQQGQLQRGGDRHVNQPSGDRYARGVNQRRFRTHDWIRQIVEPILQRF